mmetsp:Transcript_39663/g.92823  ORF Transcript_39663/g.92823 Transcript_39663/m.92823 type:complete len:173 (-) Transcript_39663:1119-1637(-)
MPPPKKKKHPLEHFLAGGAAGLVETSVCHPLDTIKTRMQLRRNLPPVVGTIPVGGGRTMPATRSRAGIGRGVASGGVGLTGASFGPVEMARRIVAREGFTSLYKGLTAVYSGIVPKMALRFWSFEQFKDMLVRICWHSARFLFLKFKIWKICIFFSIYFLYYIFYIHPNERS